MGLELDEEEIEDIPAAREGLISKDDSRLAAFVIPTDEELLIARDTVRCVLGAPLRQ
jgi:acetate kinase